MKDITRIHIAKVPYSIELAAKKELENYIKALESYTSDSELMQDIEIRITELLTERGIKEEDVISHGDVIAIRAQLGEPEEFLSEETVKAETEKDSSGRSVRRLYRDLDGALLGGVLSGFAQFLRVDVVWVRLAFIALTFVTAGTFLLLYPVAWLLIPAAHTAAEKLQLMGRPVTLAAIRDVSDPAISEASQRRQALLKRIGLVLVGVGAVFTALTSIAVMAVVAMQLALGQDIGDVSGYEVPIALMFTSGALLILLSLIAAFAAFMQKFNKRIWISSVIIIALGLLTFSSALFLGVIQERTDRQTRERNMVETTQTLPAEFIAAKTLSVDIPTSTELTYIVDPASTTIKQHLTRGLAKAEVTVSGADANISMKEPASSDDGLVNSLTVYGPALESLSVKNGYVRYEKASQQTLRIEAQNQSSITIDDSRIETLQAALFHSSHLDSSHATIASIELDLSSQPSVALGNIKSLAVKNPQACATDAAATITVSSILSPTFTLNGADTPSRSFESPCFTMRVEGEEFND